MHDTTNELFGDFFSPSALLTSLLLVRATPGCDVFFCAREGGLLRYQSDATESEAELVTLLSRTHATVPDIEASLFPYDRNAQSYVHRVAEAGTLEVMMTDEVWTQEGRIGPDWAPFAMSPTL